MSDEVRRFFVDALPEAGGEVDLSSASRHARVLRLGVGDEVVLFDGSGREALAQVVSISPFRCAADAPTRAEPDAPTIHLIQALPKGKKLEMIVRMATELGVDEIHLAVSERAVSRLEGRRGDARAERLSRIAREAARQARRRTVPKIHAPASLDEASRRAPSGSQRLVFWENATGGPPRALDHRREVWVIVGPEGGLSHTEVSALSHRGWAAVGLGRGILRVETASPVALAIILDRLGRLRPITGSTGA